MIITKSNEVRTRPPSDFVLMSSLASTNSCQKGITPNDVFVPSSAPAGSVAMQLFSFCS